ncbi:MAG: hypothetical protein ACQESE_05005 [Nanobdellota archaeon]
MFKPELKKAIDIGVSGFDRSGTSTQINGIINHLETKYDLRVKDFRGSENAALFHADKFMHYINGHRSLKEFLLDNSVPVDHKQHLAFEFMKLLEGVYEDNGTYVFRKADMDMKVAAINDDEKNYTKISPDFLDVGVFEEPSKRTAGVSSRKTELKMSAFDRLITPYENLIAHSVYRKDEFLRFREKLRQMNKIIVRSRTEESTIAYQFKDENVLSNGSTLEQFMSMPGITEYALKYPATHLFIVCGPENMTLDNLKEIYSSRDDGRIQDDHEKNLDYQLLVNNRYASGFVERMYEKLCPQVGSQKPEFIYLDLKDNIPTMNKKIASHLDRIIEENKA